MNSPSNDKPLPQLVRDEHSWDRLRKALRDMGERHPGRLKFVANEGNAGDALIAAGTWQFFEDMTLNPPCVRLRGIKAGDAPVYGGGGNLVNEYMNCAWFLERCLAVDVAEALVMPQTIRGHEDLLRRLDDRFTLVCRDTDSLRRVQATGTRAKILFAPDMALYLNVPRLFATCDAYRGPRFWLRGMPKGRVFAYLRWRWALSRRRPQAQGQVSILRVDVEATSAAPGDRRWDVSNLYGSSFRSRAESEMVARDYLAFFEKVSRVRTNRLHAGVAGALMGCEVTYLDNSYGKVSAVYDAWLSHLPFVRFEATPESA